jgi:ubiquinone/menaquinone biosynthesis C-methylase UbiE
MKIKGFKDTIEWYNANAEDYAEKSQTASSVEAIEDFVEHLKSGDLVLDAGCGAGRDSNRLTQAGLKTIGIDISSGLITQAKKRFPELEFREGSFLELEFQDSKFNGIWAHASLVHLETEEDSERAIQEFSRVLKKNGILHLLVRAQVGENKTEVVSDSVSGHDRFFRYYSNEEIQQLLTKYDFTVADFQRYPDAKGRPGIEWALILATKNS